MPIDFFSKNLKSTILGHSVVYPLVLEFIQTIFQKLFCKVIILIPFIHIDLGWNLTPRKLESFTPMFFYLITRGKMISTTKGFL